MLFLLLYDFKKPDFVSLWKIVTFFFLKICSILNFWNSQCQPFIFRYWTVFVHFILTPIRPLHLNVSVLQKTFFSKYCFSYIYSGTFTHASSLHIRSPFYVFNTCLFFLGCYFKAFRIVYVYMYIYICMYMYLYFE